MIYSYPAQPHEAFEIELRAEDAREVSEGWREELAQSIKHGTAVSYRDQFGNLVGIFGFNESDREVGPWLLCSGLVEGHRREVAQLARQWVGILKGISSDRLVYNFIPKDNARNRAFVTSLGFRILPSPREGFDFFYLPPNV